MDDAQGRSLHEGREGALRARQAHTRALRIREGHSRQVCKGETLVAVEGSEECVREIQALFDLVSEKEEHGLREDVDCEEIDCEEFDCEEILLEVFAGAKSPLA